MMREELTSAAENVSQCQFSVKIFKLFGSVLSETQQINDLSGTGTLALNGSDLYLANGGNFERTGTGSVWLTSGSFNLGNTIEADKGIFSVQSGSTMNALSSGTLNAIQITVDGQFNLAGTATTTDATIKVR